MTRFSFILPAYKTRFLSEALGSICGQSFPDYHVIVSDDCSPEDVFSTVEPYLADSRFSYRRNDSNMGADRLVEHWNLLLGQCNSEYVIIASDDDVYASGFLEKIEKAVCAYPEVDLIRVRAETVNGDGNVIGVDPECTEFWSQEEFLHHFINPDSVLCIGNYVFRTETLKRMGGFVRFPLGWKSDTATEITMAANGVVCISECLFSFRMSGTNISSSQVRNFGKDAAKLDAILLFESWLGKQINDPMMLGAFRNRLEGEARSYYWTADRKAFSSMFKRMRRDGWFRTFRNKLSFLSGWLKTRFFS